MADTTTVVNHWNQFYELADTIVKISAGALISGIATYKLTKMKNNHDMIQLEAKHTHETLAQEDTHNHNITKQKNDLDNEISKVRMVQKIKILEENNKILSVYFSAGSALVDFWYACLQRERKIEELEGSNLKKYEELDNVFFGLTDTYHTAVADFLMIGNDKAVNKLNSFYHSINTQRNAITMGGSDFPTEDTYNKIRNQLRDFRSDYYLEINTYLNNLK